MKTKLGLSVGFLAAITYFLGLFSGYTALILLVGYVLLCEEDSWLKKSVVKALVISLCFSVLYYVIDFIPTLLNLVDDIFGIFKSSFYPSSIYSLFDFFQNGLNIIKEIVMIILGIMALGKKTINIAPIDKLVD